MSMPFRFAVSEKPVTILPFAGHIQSRSSSSGSADADSFFGAVGGGSPAAVEGAEATAVGGAGFGGSARATACGSGAFAISRASASEYGSFTAFGATFSDSVLRGAGAG